MQEGGTLFYDEILGFRETSLFTTNHNSMVAIRNKAYKCCKRAKKEYMIGEAVQVVKKCHQHKCVLYR